MNHHVKSPALEFRKQNVSGVTADFVRKAKGKNPALSLFLQKALEEYVARGGKLNELAGKADVAPSLLTQLKNRGEGAGHGSAPKIANALGLDYPEMWQRAEDWFKRTGGKGPLPDDALVIRRAPLLLVDPDPLTLALAKIGSDMIDPEAIEIVRKTKRYTAGQKPDIDHIAAELLQANAECRRRRHDAAGVAAADAEAIAEANRVTAIATKKPKLKKPGTKKLNKDAEE